MGNIKAYIKLEYIGPKRDLEMEKTFLDRWKFNPANNYICEVPGDVADRAMDFPDVFRVHWENTSTGVVSASLEKRLADLEVRVAKLEKPRGRPPKDKE